MSRNELIAVIVACLSAVAVILGPFYIVTHNSTERTKACVESGGSYLRVPETTAMECRR
jgi:hypothetical protein